jgi:hypothetical protein
MPGLSRSTKSLLRRVNGETHATDEDHEPPVKRQSARNKISKPNPPSNDRTVLQRPAGSQDHNREPESDDELSKPAIQSSPKRKRNSRNVDNKDAPKKGDRQLTTNGSNGKKQSDREADFEDEDAKTIAMWNQKGSKPKLKKQGGYSKSKAVKASSKENNNRQATQALQVNANRRVFVVPDPVPGQPVRVFQDVPDIPGFDSRHKKSFQDSHSIDSKADQTSVTDVNDSDQEVKPSPVAKGPQCPHCNSPVEAKALERFKKGNPGWKWDMHAQHIFCKRHKRNAGKVEWEKRGYPTIDWDKMGNRMEKFEEEMMMVLTRRKRTIHRIRFMEFLKNGNMTALQQSVPERELGYYGFKGFSRM